MTSKQKLTLFFIDTEFACNQYNLIKHLDRWDFPANLSENLLPLLTDKLIFVNGFDSNGNPFNYALTEKGKLCLKETNFDEDILNYIRAMKSPTFLLQITEALIKRESNK